MIDLLGLFPSFLAGRFGGVEASAFAAWRALVRDVESSLLLSFGEVPQTYDTSAVGPAVFAATKQAALKEAWKAAPAQTVFLWHVGLLKLLPAISRHPNRRVVLFLHGIEVWREPDFLTRHLLSQVDLFLSNSEHTWRRFLTFHPKAAATPHQVVALGLGNALPAPAKQSSASPAAIIIGRMEQGEGYKGHQELIAAWPAVRARIPDAQLWIVGGGNLRPTLETLVASLHLEDAIRFEGMVPDGRKEELLQQARCLAMPSRGEGFGLVYLEAMRFGRPCLVSTSDAGREVIAPPDSGLAVDPTDPAALADAVVRLLSPGPTWDQWSVQSFQRYNQYFTEARFVERLRNALFTARAAQRSLAAERLA